MLAVASVRRFVSVIVGYLQVRNGNHGEAVVGSCSSPSISCVLYDFDDLMNTYNLGQIDGAAVYGNSTSHLWQPNSHTSSISIERNLYSHTRRTRSGLSMSMSVQFTGTHATSCP